MPSDVYSFWGLYSYVRCLCWCLLPSEVVPFSRFQLTTRECDAFSWSFSSELLRADVSVTEVGYPRLRTKLRLRRFDQRCRSRDNYKAPSPAPWEQIRPIKALVIKSKTQLQHNSWLIIIEIDDICGEERAWKSLVQSDAAAGNRITFVWLFNGDSVKRFGPPQAWHHDFVFTSLNVRSSSLLNYEVLLNCLCSILDLSINVFRAEIMTSDISLMFRAGWTDRWLLVFIKLYFSFSITLWKWLQ